MGIVLNTVNELNNSISSDNIMLLEKSLKKESVKIKDSYYIARYFDQSRIKPIQWFIRRVIELSITLFSVIIFIPVFIVIAIAIKLESDGPILFKQKRIGKHGKCFYMYKFRSMYKDAEKQLESLKKYNETNELMFKMFNDPRVTKVGKFLRKYSLDELPQLINVFKGEMGLIGFRPPLPSEVENYKSWHYTRFASLPGLTGPWQVNGRSNIKNFDDVVILEFEYAKNWNLLKDIEILAKTIPVVLAGKNSA